MRKILLTTLRLTIGTAARMHCWDVEFRFTPAEQNHPQIIPAGFRACCLSALVTRLCFGTQQSGSFRERRDCQGALTQSRRRYNLARFNIWPPLRPQFTKRPLCHRIPIRNCGIFRLRYGMKRPAISKCEMAGHYGWLVESQSRR